MKSAKLIMFTAVLLIVLAPLAYLALWWPTRRHVARRDRLEASVEYMTPLHREYRDGDYAHAKAAMLEVVRHLEEYEAESINQGRGEFRNEDAMLAYVRLARLEEKHGGAQAAQFMRDAVERCAMVKWRRGQGGGRWPKCEASYLRDAVDKLDANIR